MYFRRCVQKVSPFKPFQLSMKQNMFFLPQLQKIPIQENKLYFPINKNLYFPKPEIVVQKKTECLLKIIQKEDMKCSNCKDVKNCCLSFKITKKYNLDKDDILEYVKMLKDLIVIIMKYYLQVRFVFRKSPKLNKSSKSLKLNKSSKSLKLNKSSKSCKLK